MNDSSDSLVSVGAPEREVHAVTTIVVEPATQVHHDGRTHEEGERLEVPAALARRWRQQGFVTIDEPKTSEPARRRRSR